MPRVVLSWLNDFLARPVTAADADRYLGEAGIAVTRVSSPGAGDPRVVVGRVEAQPPESDCCVTASVPTPERVSAPAGPPPPAPLSRWRCPAPSCSTREGGRACGGSIARATTRRRSA